LDFKAELKMEYILIWKIEAQLSNVNFVHLDGFLFLFMNYVLKNPSEIFILEFPGKSYIALKI